MDRADCPEGKEARNMKREQLMGRHIRLQGELAVAYSKVPWQTAWIDRLADDLASVEREIGAIRLGDSQPRRRFDHGEPRSARSSVI
jgi:hypothetical protein